MKLPDPFFEQLASDFILKLRIALAHERGECLDMEGRAACLEDRAGATAQIQFIDKLDRALSQYHDGLRADYCSATRQPYHPTALAPISFGPADITN